MVTSMFEIIDGVSLTLNEKKWLWMPVLFSFLGFNLNLIGPTKRLILIFYTCIIRTEKESDHKENES